MARCRVWQRGSKSCDNELCVYDAEGPSAHQRYHTLHASEAAIADEGLGLFPSF